jgi:ABC-type nitrate/sulfonate/bicarbonate transport system permease component
VAGVTGKSAIAADPTAALRLVRSFGWGSVSWLVVILIALCWEGLARSGAVTPFMLPPLSVVVETIVHDAQSGDLFSNLGLTLYRALTGFAISTVIGIGLGVAIARVGAVRWFFDPIISVGFPMPKIAFLPIVVLWFGFHDVSKIAMVIFDATFPVLTATIVATRAVERELLWSARSMGANERQMLHEVVLPAALPEIMTGLQVALPIALIVCIVAEMLTGGIGLGGAMITASRFANSPGVFAGIVEIGVVGYCLVKGMSMLRRRLLAWHPEAQAPTTV